MLGSSNTIKTTLPRRNHIESAYGLKTLPTYKLTTNDLRLDLKAMISK